MKNSVAACEFKRQKEIAAECSDCGVGRSAMCSRETCKADLVCVGERSSNGARRRYIYIELVALSDSQA